MTLRSIIAIHPRPQYGRDPQFHSASERRNRKSRLVNWLYEKEMLPSVLENKLPARIFIYKWEANTFDDASSHAFRIQAEILVQKMWEMCTASDAAELPIIFIASCFDGLRLAKALVFGLAREPHSPGQAILSRTKDIVFLGTPFRGSGGAEPAAYRVMVARLLGGSTASDSLLRVLSNKPGNRDELTAAFVTLASER
jgi:hypothetical protein